MKRGNANWFIKNQHAPLDTQEEVVFPPVRYIPMVVDVILTRLGRASWRSQDDFELGYSQLNRFLWELTMGAKADLITEIRDLRGKKPDAPPEPEGGYPVGAYPGFQFKDMYQQATDANLNRETEHNAAIVKLDEIKAAIEAAGADSEEIISILGRLAVFFGV